MNDLKTLPKVIGTKQTLRAIAAGRVKTIILAADADKNIKTKIAKAGRNANVEILSCESKRTLGNAGGINRDAAVVAILND